MARTKGAKSGVYGNKIDKEQFEKLCKIMCTEAEICDYFGVSNDTVNRWCRQEYEDTFENILRAKASLGKISIRRYQMQQAEKNPVMSIWLGKQYLGQTDKVEQTNLERIEFVDDMSEEEDPKDAN